MDYPTPDGVWCKRCGHGYWQYPDRDPKCPQCEQRTRKVILKLQEENKALREAAEDTKKKGDES